MSSSFAALASVALLPALVGCSVDVSLEGKQCPCGAGYVCNSDNRCESAGPTCPAVATSTGDRLAVGEHHNCVVRQGALWCWGNNASGQLGLGDSAAHALPARVGTDADWESVSAGATHTCGIRRQPDGFGALNCWGANDSGQLGFGDYVARLAPERVTENTSFERVSAGDDHTCAIATGGHLWCWGRQAGGALGTGVVEPEHVPAPVQVGEELYGTLDAGLGHNCAVSQSGKLWCWGHDECWQTATTTHQLSPHRVDSGCWSSATAGMRHSCAIDSAGVARCFGDNSQGQLGRGFSDGGEATTTECSSFVDPAPVAESNGGASWSRLSAGKLHTCGIDENSTLWCWGYNEQHQTSDGPELSVGTPARRGARSWAEVGAGFFHTCALEVTGDVYCAGQNNFDEQGTGTDDAVLTRVSFAN